MTSKQMMIGLTAAALIGGTAGGGQNCPDQTGPDVIVGVLPSIQYWGTVGGVSAYSIATTSCNIGDEELLWIDVTNEHPVIAQNIYKLTDARIEQVGLSWVKHGFGSLQGQACCTACIPAGTFDRLGVGCSDPYTTDLNGDQAGFFGVAGLGPRSDVNPATGFFNFPYPTQGTDGDAVFKRIQIDNADLDPAQNEVGVR